MIVHFFCEKVKIEISNELTILICIFSVMIRVFISIFFVYTFRWMYTINRSEAKEKQQQIGDIPNEKVQKSTDEKQLEINLQNEGLSVISDIKSL